MAAQNNRERLLALTQQMMAAATALDFELAARLRNEIAHIKGEEVIQDEDGAVIVTVSQPPPGAMGLGTHVPVRQPPKGWAKPQRPDLTTSGLKRRK